MTGLVGEDWIQILFLFLLLIFIGGGLVAEFAGRRSAALRQLGAWAMIFGVAVAAALWWEGQQANRQTVLDGRRIEVSAGPGGHFLLTAEVNGTDVVFVVDTGATDIALTQRDAERIGIDPDTLAYTGTAVTANGEIGMARVTLADFRIGDIVDKGVSASVTEGDLGTSLLGMSYLRRFARVGFEGNLLILER